MPLQDLTPQLRTRLNRMERAVGWFVTTALVLLLAGFLSYIYHAAENKGWFKIKAQFVTYIKSATGINVGDPVYMMGFPVGQVLSVEPPPPRVPQDVKVVFEIKEPYFRYIWTKGSYVKANSSGLLGRELEVTRATNGFALCSTHPVRRFTLAEITEHASRHPNRWQLFENIYDANSNLVLGAYSQLVTTNGDGSLNATNLARLADLKVDEIYAYDNQVKRHGIVSVWNRQRERYEEADGNPVYLAMDETPALTERLDQIVAQVQTALPGILAITNRVNLILDHTADVTSNLNNTLIAVQPMVTNFALLSGNLRAPGGLGAWVLNTNGLDQVGLALTNVNLLLAHSDTNLDALSQDIATSLIHLGNITSNLDTQVENNPQAISNIMKTITDSDDMIQGLKRHWLLRSAFKTKKTNAPPVKPSP